MVIDKQVVIVGSYYYTSSTNYVNDENIIIIGDLDSMDPDSVQAQKQIGEYAYDEIKRIINIYGEKIEG